MIPTIKRSKSAIYLSIAIFLISFVSGLCTSALIPPPNAQFSQEKFVNSLGPNEAFDSILENNLRVALAEFFGIASLGLSTSISLSASGLSLGMVVGSALAETQVGSIFILTIPHAVLELPALWLAGAAGFKIPYEVIRYLIGRKDYILNRRELKDYVYLSLASVVLIIIAAWVEANVTMRIAESMT